MHFISDQIGNVIDLRSRSLGALTRRPASVGVLKLKRDPRGRFHALCGRRVDLGDTIELQRIGDTWISGFYDWSGRSGEPPVLVSEGVAFELTAADVVRFPPVP